MPCAVYTRDSSRHVAPKFEFSHWCTTAAVPKAFPSTLTTQDLRAHNAKQNWVAMQKACFLVLVSGDVAQSISLSNVGDKNRVRFLYKGSQYARNTALALVPSELDDKHILMHFYASLAVYGERYQFVTATPIESGVALLPRTICDADLTCLAAWVATCTQRSLSTSVWVTHTGDSYNEHTGRCCPSTAVITRALFNGHRHADNGMTKSKRQRNTQVRGHASKGPAAKGLASDRQMPRTHSHR